MIRFLVRAFIACIPRFLIITALLSALRYLDTSPLPEAQTYFVLAYLIHFGATYLVSAWIFAKHRPAWTEAGAVTAVLVVFGTVLDVAANVVILKRPWSIIFYSYNWQSLAVISVYVLAVFLAAWRARWKHPQNLPEGLSA